MLAEKIEALLRTEEAQHFKAGLLIFFARLFTYIHAVIENNAELQKSFALVRSGYRSIMDSVRQVVQTEALQVCERRLEDVQIFLKRMEQSSQEVVRRNQELESRYADDQARIKAAELRVEYLTQKNSEIRSGLKQAEKKLKQDESKYAAIITEKKSVEEKLKAARKELDQLKRKSTEERNMARKLKDRDIEKLCRLENESAEREALRERERKLYEEKLREARINESKAEKERKHAVSITSGILERARNAEAAQISLMYRLLHRCFEKAQEEVAAGLSEAEKNFKRGHHSDADPDLKKNLHEWRSASEELEKIIRKTKAEYDQAADIVRRGQKSLSCLRLSQPTLPAFPKTIRLLPVQVVRPSRSHHHVPPPTIVTPSAGVIGQPRVSSSSSYGTSLEPMKASETSIWNEPFYCANVNNGDSSAQNHSEAKPMVTMPSLWSWSSPLDNIAMP